MAYPAATSSTSAPRASGGPRSRLRRSSSGRRPGRGARSAGHPRRMPGIPVVQPAGQAGEADCDPGCTLRPLSSVTRAARSRSGRSAPGTRGPAPGLSLVPYTAAVLATTPGSHRAGRGSAPIRSATVIPSRSWSLMSNKTTSWAEFGRSATGPASVAASPTTVNPSASSSARIDARNSAWSSTTSTLRTPRLSRPIASVHPRGRQSCRVVGRSPSLCSGQGWRKSGRLLLRRSDKISPLDTPHTANWRGTPSSNSGVYRPLQRW